MQNEADGIVTGNVFPTAGGSGVQFLYCADASESSGSAMFGSCFLAAPAHSTGCGADDWQSIAGSPEVAASFLAIRN